MRFWSFSRLCRRGNDPLGRLPCCLQSPRLSQNTLPLTTLSLAELSAVFVLLPQVRSWKGHVLLSLSPGPGPIVCGWLGPFLFASPVLLTLGFLLGSTYRRMCVIYFVRVRCEPDIVSNDVGHLCVVSIHRKWFCIEVELGNERANCRIDTTTTCWHFHRWVVSAAPSGETCCGKNYQT